jgi:transcriptional regulator with XRE-family HTH domain
MDIKRILGNNIRLHRKKLNLTQEELAEKLEVSSTHLARLEAGAKFASPELIAKLAETFSISPAFLFITSELKPSDDIYFNRIEEIINNEVEILKKRIREIGS